MNLTKIGKVKNWNWLKSLCTGIQVYHIVETTIQYEDSVKIVLDVFNEDYEIVIGSANNVREAIRIVQSE